jgi:branched-chain amino acid transport system substrate-binding protein
MRSMRINRSAKILLASTGALALLLTACSSGSSSGSKTSASGGASSAAPDVKETGVSATTINLSSSQTLSGAGAASCKPQSDAASAWFDSVNKAGGVQGRQINYTVLDDGYDPTRAIANARTLEPSNLLMVGECGSTTAAAIYKQLSAAGMPFLFPVNGVGNATTPVTPGYFQLQPLYEDEIATMINYGFGQDGPGSVYAVVNPLGSYQAVLDSAKSVSAAKGGSYLGGDETALGTPDYTPIAQKIKAAKPDYVVMSLGGTDYAKLINTLVQQNAMPNKLIMGVAASGAFLGAYDTSVASKIRFASLAQLPLDPTTACGKVLVGAAAADPGAIQACAEAQMITTAIADTKPITRTGISKTLESWNNKDVAPGVIAPVTFSATQHLGTTTLYVVQPVGSSSWLSLAKCPYGTSATSKTCTPVSK